MKNSKLLFCIPILIQLTSLQAQDIKSTTSGFAVSIFGNASSWMSTSNFVGSLDEEEPGSVGGGAMISYGLDESITFFISYAQSSHSTDDIWDQFTHQVMNGGVRLNFGATLKSLRPFLQAGISQHTMKIDPIVLDNDFSVLYNLRMIGIGGDVGAGVHYFIKPSLSVEIGAYGRFGNFNNISLSGQTYDPENRTDFRFLTGQIGITYFLQ